MTLREFDFRLAAMLGWRSATEMLRRLPHREYVGWKILEERWPIGWERDDMRIARLMCLVANMFGGSRRVGDFLPPKPIAARSDDELFAAGCALAEATGGTDGR